MQKVLFSAIIILALACNNSNPTNTENTRKDSYTFGQNTATTKDLSNQSNSDQGYFVNEIAALYKKSFINPINNAIPALYPEQFEQIMKPMKHKKIEDWQGEIETVYLDNERNIELQMLFYETAFKFPDEKNISMRLIVGDSYEDESMSASNADMRLGVHLDNKLINEVLNPNKKHKQSKDSKYLHKHSKTKLNSQNKYYTYLLNLSRGTRIRIWGTIDDYSDQLHDVIPQNFKNLYTVEDIKLFISIDSVSSLN